MTGDQIPIRRHRVEHVETYDVFGDELDAIEREAATIGTDLQYALFWLPLGLSFTASLLLTTIKSDRVYSAFFIITVMSYAFAVYFGIRWWQRKGNFQRLLSKIRERQVGPVGDEGKELKPAELEALPSEQAGPLK
jgi:hypothetical protein